MNKKNISYGTVGMVIISVYFVLFMQLGMAQASDAIPDVVTNGFNEYKTKGAEGALKAWLKGSAMETNLEAQSQANIFRQVESLYGPYLGHEIININKLSSTSKIIYIAMNYEKGAIFARFLTYENKEKSIVALLNFNTKPELILPSNMIGE